MTTGSGYQRSSTTRPPKRPDQVARPAEGSGMALVVDDDPSIARLLIFYLREAGFNPVYAPDGLQALALAGRHKLALVLLDVMLPGLNGWEVCRELRSLSGVPIIMLTSKSSEQDISICLSAGADDFLAKPFHGHELISHIEAVIHARCKQPEQPEPQGLDAPVPAPVAAALAPAPPQIEPLPPPAPAAHSRATPRRPTRRPELRAAEPGLLLPGTQLRRARRIAQLTLPQVEQETGIRSDYLQSLEQDELSTIPTHLRRPILARYAQLLGLEPDGLWTQFMAATSPDPERRPASRLLGALIACALIFLLALLVALYAGVL